MMSMITLFIVLFLFGYFLVNIFKLDLGDNMIDNIIICIGLGLGLFIIISILFSLVGIPLDWYIYVMLAIIVVSPLIKKYDLVYRKPKFDKSHIFSIIVLVLFIINALVFINGSFKYPWLEDSDPWGHALATKYVSTEKTMFQDASKQDLIKYLDPYPASYAALMSFVYQINGDMIFSLKVLNALLVALCIPLSYLMFSKLFNDKSKALLASTILLLTPCFLTHFIWALTLAILMFFPTIYAFEKIDENPKWMYIAAIMWATLTMTQPSMALKLSIMVLLYIFGKMIVTKSYQKKLLVTILMAICISMLWWGSAYIRWGNPLDHEWEGVYGASFEKGVENNVNVNPGWFRVRGTADREYSFMDFFIAKGQNLINNPVGLGIVLCILAMICFTILIPDILSVKWVTVSMLWVIFAFIGINGVRLPVQFIAFRFWMLFAIPIAILVSGGVFVMIQKYGLSKYIVIGLVLVGIAATSGFPKYMINTSAWGPGDQWGTQQELNNYFKLYEVVPKGWSVYSFCPNADWKLVALDFENCAWCEDEYNYKSIFINESVDDVYKFMKDKEYYYLVIDGQCVEKFGLDNLNIKINEMVNSTKFEPWHNVEGMLVMEIK